MFLKKKILIICPQFAPAIGPRANRWTTVAVYLKSKGHDVHVVTSYHPDRSQKEEIINDVKVYRAGFNAIKDIYYRVFKVKHSRRGYIRPVTVERFKELLDNIAAAEQYPEKVKSLLRHFEIQRQSKKAAWWNKILVNAHDFFWKSLFWPDSAWIWYFPALKKARELWKKENGFDCVISVALPFTSHLVAQSLRGKFDFNWIADTGDPFFLQVELPQNNLFLYRKKNFNAEKKVLERADHIVVTNEVLKQEYQSYFPTTTLPGFSPGKEKEYLSSPLEGFITSANDKVKTIPPTLPGIIPGKDKKKPLSPLEGFNSPASDKITVIPPLAGFNTQNLASATHTREMLEPFRSSNSIHFGYFGSFFKNIRTPHLLLYWLNRWFELMPAFSSRVEVHFFGDIFQEFKKIFWQYPALKSNIHFYGLVSRDMVPAFMETMDFLINIGNQTTYQLPSKTADYIFSGKPVINFCYQQNDIFSKAFENYPLFINVPGIRDIVTDEDIRKTVSFIEKHNHKNISDEALLPLVQPFMSDTVGEAYNRLI